MQIEIPFRAMLALFKSSLDLPIDPAYKEKTFSPCAIKEYWQNRDITMPLHDLPSIFSLIDSSHLSPYPAGTDPSVVKDFLVKELIHRLDPSTPLEKFTTTTNPDLNKALLALAAAQFTSKHADVSAVIDPPFRTDNSIVNLSNLALVREYLSLSIFHLERSCHFAYQGKALTSSRVRNIIQAHLSKCALQSQINLPESNQSLIHLFEIT